MRPFISCGPESSQWALRLQGMTQRPLIFAGTQRVTHKIKSPLQCLGHTNNVQIYALLVGPWEAAVGPVPTERVHPKKRAP